MHIAYLQYFTVIILLSLFIIHVHTHIYHQNFCMSLGIPTLRAEAEFCGVLPDPGSHLKVRMTCFWQKCHPPKKMPQVNQWVNCGCFFYIKKTSEMALIEALSSIIVITSKLLSADCF